VNDCFHLARACEPVQQPRDSNRVRIRVFAAAVKILAAVVVLAGSLPAQERANAARVRPQWNMQAHTACESEMLREMGAREAFSGKVYEVMTDVARAYDRAIPHIYVFSGSLNMAYIAGSAAVDGRGKIVVGQQAIELFDPFSLRGFLGHEMAHLVTDSAAQGCNDYILRDPQIEAEADALAARTLGKAPVKAFLQRALTLTESQNWEAKHRLEVLH
jgi:Peptidase family M48